MKNLCGIGLSLYGTSPHKTRYERAWMYGHTRAHGPHREREPATATYIDQQYGRDPDGGWRNSNTRNNARHLAADLEALHHAEAHVPNSQFGVLASDACDLGCGPRRASQ